MSDFRSDSTSKWINDEDHQLKSKLFWIETVWRRDFLFLSISSRVSTLPCDQDIITDNLQTKRYFPLCRIRRENSNVRCEVIRSNFQVIAMIIRMKIASFVSPWCHLRLERMNLFVGEISVKTLCMRNISASNGVDLFFPSGLIWPGHANGSQAPKTTINRRMGEACANKYARRNSRTDKYGVQFHRINHKVIKLVLKFYFSWMMNWGTEIENI